MESGNIIKLCIQVIGNVKIINSPSKYENVIMVLLSGRTIRLLTRKSYANLHNHCITCITIINGQFKIRLIELIILKKNEYHVVQF
jgi:hypothetical protein